MARILWIAALLIATLAAIWSYRSGGSAALDLVWLARSAPPLFGAFVIPLLLAIAVGGLRQQARGLSVAVRAAHCIGFLGLVYFFARLLRLGEIEYYFERSEELDALGIERWPIEPGFWAAAVAVAVGSIVFDPLRTYALKRDARRRRSRLRPSPSPAALALHRRSGFLYARLGCFAAALGLLGVHALGYIGRIRVELVPIAAVVGLPYLLLLVSHSPRESAAAFRAAFAIEPVGSSRASFASSALVMEALGRYSTSAGTLGVLWCAVRSPLGFNRLEQALVLFILGSALRWLFYDPLRELLDGRAREADEPMAVT